jgi:hypothetical protein
MGAGCAKIKSVACRVGKLLIDVVKDPKMNFIVEWNRPLNNTCPLGLSAMDAES